ncbi:MULTISPECIES: DUF7686 domain-containing protein [Paraburkholderia]|uniref:DUF7686 domain-containing protein n=1 Tax=Paraburkholderia TaxID=1822464 RepID=UPI001FE2B978|nr:hypothetical protein [Paraburkholderia podalyriae]
MSVKIAASDRQLLRTQMRLRGAACCRERAINRVKNGTGNQHPGDRRKNQYSRHDMAHERCEQCGNPTPPWDAIHCGSGEGSYELLCTSCFNARIAESTGFTDFENVRLDPIRMIDCEGEAHQFHFQLRLLGDRIALDAFELRGELRTGYRFQLIGEADDDVFVLLGRLVERMRRALSVRHIDFRERRIIDSTVRGRIEWDESQAGYLPLAVVDGKEVSWDDLGQMLMSMEGWQFRLDIADPSEEL